MCIHTLGQRGSVVHKYQFDHLLLLQKRYLNMDVTFIRIICKSVSFGIFYYIPEEIFEVAIANADNRLDFLIVTWINKRHFVLSNGNFNPFGAVGFCKII